MLIISRVDDSTKAIKTDTTIDTWIAYAEKTGDGGDCAGDVLGSLKDGCHNVDTLISGQRIYCVYLEANAL